MSAYNDEKDESTASQTKLSNAAKASARIVWVAITVITLFNIMLVFGGTFMNSIVIDSLQKRFSEAKKEINSEVKDLKSQTRKVIEKAITLCNQSLVEIDYAAGDVEQKKKDAFDDIKKAKNKVISDIEKKIREEANLKEIIKAKDKVIKKINASQGKAETDLAIWKVEAIGDIQIKRNAAIKEIAYIAESFEKDINGLAEEIKNDKELLKNVNVDFEAGKLSNKIEDISKRIKQTNSRIDMFDASIDALQQKVDARMALNNINALSTEQIFKLLTSTPFLIVLIAGGIIILIPCVLLFALCNLKINKIKTLLNHV